MFLPVVHEVLEESGGSQFVHLADYTDAHVTIPPEEPLHVFTGSWRENKENKMYMKHITSKIYSHYTQREMLSSIQNEVF